jgi:hypothetical protein
MAKSDIEIVVEDVLGSPIAFSRSLVRISKSVTAALMLSQALYWSKRTGEECNGWFYKSQDEWEDETGMGRREQENARKALRGIGVLFEERRGVPARLWFKVDKVRIAELLGFQAAAVDPEKYLAMVGFMRNDLNKLSEDALQAAKSSVLEGECKGATYVSYADIFIRDKGICNVCGKLVTRPPGHKTGCLRFEYVTPLKEGGYHRTDNIRVAHAYCKASPASMAESANQERQFHPDMPGAKRQSPIDTENTTKITTGDRHSPPTTAGAPPLTPAGGSPCTSGTGISDEVGQVKDRIAKIQTYFEGAPPHWTAKGTELAEEYFQANTKVQLEAVCYVVLRAWHTVLKNPRETGRDPYYYCRIIRDVNQLFKVHPMHGICMIVGAARELDIDMLRMGSEEATDLINEYIGCSSSD